MTFIFLLYSLVVILATLSLLKSFKIQKIKKNYNLGNKIFGNRLPFGVRKYVLTLSTYNKFSFKLSSSEDDELKIEISKIENKIEKCEEDIKLCEVAILSIESKLLNCTDANEKKYLRKDKADLRKKEADLRKKEADLRKEKADLMKKGGGEYIIDKTRENINKAKLSDDGFFLELPIVMRFNKVSPLKYLYIRNDYTELYDIISKHLSSPSSSDDYIRSFVITGTPGIGKSSFLFYLLWKFFTGNSPQDEIWKDREIFYQISNFAIYHFKSNNQLAVYDARTCTFVMNERSVLIADMTDVVSPILHTGITIVLSSPNELRFKELLKYKDSLQLFMNVWTKEEVNKLWEHSYKDKLSLERVNYAFDKLGGVIRYVLEKNKDCDKVLEIAFDKYSNNFRALAMSLGSTNVKDTDISYTLIHYVSKLANHEDGKLQFASLHILQEIVKKIQSDDIELVLKFCGASQYPQLQSYVGIKFEEFVHESIPENGLQIVKRLMPMRNLTIKAQKNFDKYGIPLKSNDLIIGNKKVESSATLSLLKIGDGIIIKDNIYYRPKISNFASSDSFLIVGNDVFFLQITVGEKHGVKQSGLNFLVEYLNSKFPGRQLKYHIVFVCPKGRVNTKQFTIQSIKNSSFGDLNNASEKVRPFIFNQWLAEVVFQDKLMMILLDDKN